jgi:hypothetical protein
VCGVCEEKEKHRVRPLEATKKKIKELFLHKIALAL